MRGTRGGLLALVIGLAVLAPLVAQGGASPSPETIVLEQIPHPFVAPVFVTAPPGDEDRVFVVQQGNGGPTADIKLMFQGGAPTTFLTVTQISSGGERGLLSMAFAPDYETSRRFYVYYTASGNGAMTVAEYLRDPVDPNVADPTTRRVVISIPHPTYGNHNGGQLQFGPDDMLYMGTGDGGSGGDPFRTGQNLQDLRGKIIRIDPRQNGTDPYTVPANNPFVGQAPWRPEIWSYGVRNPWRFSFDRLTGALTIGDVGQNAWEEIDYRPIEWGWGRAANFGWSCMEGRHLYGNCPEPANHIPPVFEYSHGLGCSITGGYVVRDPNIASLAGRYLYVDYCGGLIRSNLPRIPDATDDRLEVDSNMNPTSFGEDACGHLHVMGDSGVYRIGSTDPPQGTCPDAFPLQTLFVNV